jgi:hypothetical protein
MLKMGVGKTNCEGCVVIGQLLVRPWQTIGENEGNTIRARTENLAYELHTLGLARKLKRMLVQHASLAYHCASVGLDVLVEELYPTQPRSRKGPARRRRLTLEQDRLLGRLVRG